MFDDNDPLLAKVRGICETFPQSTEQISHGRPVFRASEKGKIYLVYGGGEKIRPGEMRRHNHAVMFLPDPSDHEALSQDGRFFVPAYFGPSGWLAIDVDHSDVDWQEITELVDASYRQIARKGLIVELDAATDH